MAFVFDKNFKKIVRTTTTNYFLASTDLIKMRNLISSEELNHLCWLAEKFNLIVKEVSNIYPYNQKRCRTYGVYKATELLAAYTTPKDIFRTIMIHGELK